MRILVVEDEDELARRLCDRLETSGFVAESVASAESALDLPDPENWSALVVDIGLPGMDGFDLVRRWRQKGFDTPIIILSARGSWQEKVEGLNAGADDYVVKPVRGEELLARLNALVRRAAGQTHAKLEAGEIMMDPGARMVWRNKSQIELTQIEYRLLHLFLLKPGHILSQGEILDHLYPMAEERDLNTVEVHIGRLRKKVGKTAIATIRGLGYRFER
ncbi:MAG: response regulator transcription factor [Sphingomonadales bacterium]|jgi:two-component system OmpR family response regulator|nr:response regulator transcription factor [Sphingomonadales bacterium]WRH74745.1 MAG: response regulator transcription factor [Sphingobium sp.]